MKKSFWRLLSCNIIRCLIVFGLYGIPLKSFAAMTLASLPTSAQPGQVAKNIRSQLPAGFTSQVPTPSAAAQVSAVASIPDVKFQLRKVFIEGSTIYSATQLATLYKPYIGKKVTQADLIQIIQAITARYSQDGYPLSTAILPKQHFRQGILQIKIIEAYVNDVAIEGNPGSLASLLSRYGEEIKRVHPIQQKTLSYYTLLANQVPGVSLRTSLQPEAALGAYKLVFHVKQRQFEPYGIVNNLLSGLYGDQQIFLGAIANSLIQPGDNTNLVGATSSDTERLRYFRISHRFPISVYGTYVEVSAEQTRTKPNGEVENSSITANNNVMGISKNYTISLNHPFILLADKKLFGWLAFSYYNNDTHLNDELLLRNAIRSIRLGSNYTFVALKGVNNITTSFSQGVNVFDAEQISTALSGLPSAEINYTRVNLNLSREQNLFYNFSLYGLLSSQYGFNTLPSPELFSYGGTPIGRAYNPGELTGDSGIGGLGELRFNSVQGYKYLNSLQYFISYDVAQVWNRSKLIVPRQDNATSAGAGVRFYFTSHLLASIEIDKPLTHDILSQQLMGKNPRAPRFFFNFDYQPFS